MESRNDCAALTQGTHVGESLLRELNDAQREAVTIPIDMHGAILAGAGTGKTRVLIHRIAWLLAHDVPPGKILAVTFTNKAASEMKERLEIMAGDRAQTVRVGTFHQIGLKILRRYGRVLGFANPDRIHPMDADESVALLRRVMKEDKSIDLTLYKPRDIFHFIQGWKEKGIAPERVTHQKKFEQELARTLYPQYEREKFESQTVDFADLILLPVRMFEARPEIVERVQNGLSHVLVDEFQDTNPLQIRFIRYLTGSGDTATTFVVGDDDQSIYSWRGADAEIFSKFLEMYQPGHMVRLEENYRCNPVILDAANAVIANNRNRLGKHLWTKRQDAHPIGLVEYEDGDREGEGIAERIADLIRSKVPPQNIAVLYRKNAFSRAVEKGLVQQGVSYRVYGGLTFFSRKEIKDAMAWLRMVDNPDNNEAFARASSSPRQNIGDKKIGALRQLAKKQGGSVWAEARKEVKGPIPEFVDKVERLRRRYLESGLVDLVAAIIGEIVGLKDFYIQTGKDRGEEFAENLDQLIAAAGSFHHRLRTGNSSATSLAPNPGDPLSEFLTESVLDADMGGRHARRSDVVSLMTVHKAKGLEFEYVFVIALEDGEFPNARNGCCANLEEERRLFYVAVTRSKHALFLSYALSRFRFGDPEPSPADREGEENSLLHPVASRFLSEIPHHFLVEPEWAGSDPTALLIEGF